MNSVEPFGSLQCNFANLESLEHIQHASELFRCLTYNRKVEPGSGELFRTKRTKSFGDTSTLIRVI